MRNKRAQVFGLYMVFITVAMILVVLGMYYAQQKTINGKIVSPMGVLKERDSLEIFETREYALVKDSLEIASGDFGTDGFLVSFRSNFFNGMSFDMKNFLDGDLYKNGVSVSANDADDLANAIYPLGNTYYDGDSMIFTRDDLARELEFEAEERDKTVFPVDFSYSFGKQYIIKYENGNYIVEALE